jgi:hypothetical protein
MRPLAIEIASEQMLAGRHEICPERVVIRGFGSGAWGRRT